MVTKGSAGDSLWDVAIDMQKQNESSDTSDDKHALILGTKNSGKTTMILRFLDKDEVPKPTTALEYTFGRRAKGHNVVKDVGHIWELGGGASLSKLLDIPINAGCIMNTSVVLVVDLSTPQDMWVTMETLLSALSARIEVAIMEAARKDSTIWDKIKILTKERVGGDHADQDMMEPFKIPLVIVGSKYDLYQELDPEKKKVIAKSLRFMAHTYGASLYFTSNKIESSVSKVRSMLSSLVFGTQATKSLQLDHSKPLVIPAGTDSMQQIGSPPIPDNEIGNLSARTPVDLWKKAFTSYFPQNSVKGRRQAEDPSKDIQFSEPVIDKLRIQKDEELERYRKASERRMKELENQAIQEGIL